VRIRQEDSNETPEWVGRGIYLKDEQSFVQDIPEALQVGLVRWNDNVFFCIGNKPKTYRKLLGTKLENEYTSYRRQTAVELTVPVYNQEYTTPSRLAELTLGLRKNISVQTDDELANPLPIHLAKLLEEYVFVK
jgi:RNaseH domain of pPIWI_RE